MIRMREAGALFQPKLHPPIPPPPWGGPSAPVPVPYVGEKIVHPPLTIADCGVILALSLDDYLQI
jgi:hypothetical protein